MAGEIQLNNTTMATESSGSIILSNVDSATNRQNLGLEIGVDIQQFDSDTTKNDVANTFTANQIISVTDNTNAALRVTQLGTGNALVVEDSTNPDSTPFVVDASGNVGIGTSPSQTLEVSGISSLGVNENDYINVRGGNGTARVEAVGSSTDVNLSLATQGAGTFYFWSGGYGGTERMRIGSDGSVTIGGTISSVPLGVYGNATWCAVFRDSGGTDRHYFTAGGVTSNSSGTFGTISDERLKENITDAAPKLSDIMRLRVVNYNLIGDSNKQLGFVAQEFEQVFPSLVFETDTRQYDEDGNFTKGLADQKIIKAGLDFAILTKAIQEQQALIESQQSQIDALTARIEALETTP